MIQVWSPPGAILNAQERSIDLNTSKFRKCFFKDKLRVTGADTNGLAFYGISSVWRHSWPNKLTASLSALPPLLGSPCLANGAPLLADLVRPCRFVSLSILPQIKPSGLDSGSISMPPLLPRRRATLPKCLPVSSPDFNCLTISCSLLTNGHLKSKKLVCEQQWDFRAISG